MGLSTFRGNRIEFGSDESKFWFFFLQNLADRVSTEFAKKRSVFKSARKLRFCDFPWHKKNFAWFAIFCFLNNDFTLIIIIFVVALQLLSLSLSLSLSLCRYHALTNACWPLNTYTLFLRLTPPCKDPHTLTLILAARHEDKHAHTCAPHPHTRARTITFGTQKSYTYLTLPIKISFLQKLAISYFHLLNSKSSGVRIKNLLSILHLSWSSSSC